MPSSATSTATASARSASSTRASGSSTSTATASGTTTTCGPSSATRHDRPVVGDWDGDGKDDIGIFGPAWPGDPRRIDARAGPARPDNQRPSTASRRTCRRCREEATDRRAARCSSRRHGKVRADLIDHVFHYGAATDVPIAGDWNGDGIRIDRRLPRRQVAPRHRRRRPLDRRRRCRSTSARRATCRSSATSTATASTRSAIFRDGKWIIDTNGNRQIDAADQVLEFGGPGDQPVVGDFNGDGTDEPALYHDGVAAGGRGVRKSRRERDEMNEAK